MQNPLRLPPPEVLTNEAFFARIRSLCTDGHSPLCLFAAANQLMYCLMGKSGFVELLCTASPADKSYPSLSIDYPAFIMFERELYEEHGIEPLGHPWLKPLRYPGKGDMAKHPFLSSASPLLHEVGVGPVHAGVIEPGHFRFICRGEIVEHLEIQLGYQHRSMMELLGRGDIRQKVMLAESIAGDTAVGHALAYCSVVEALTNTKPAARQIRVIALELERCAMHLSVLSALAGDIAYIMGQNLFAALRTTLINSSLAICGSRFGKRWLCPGGVNYGLSQIQKQKLQQDLSLAKAQIILTAQAMFADSNVLSRMDETGVISTQTAEQYGFTGIAAKASGVATDARSDYPLVPLPDFSIFTENSGDVYARAWLRYREIVQSLTLIENALSQLEQAETLCSPVDEVTPNTLAVAIVEGFRGRIVHIAKTGAGGETEFYRIYDPSLVNWQALAFAVRGEGISDFPLCNKSFDLSYCGSDL